MKQSVEFFLSFCELRVAILIVSMTMLAAIVVVANQIEASSLSRKMHVGRLLLSTKQIYSWRGGY